MKFYNRLLIVGSLLLATTIGQSQLLETLFSTNYEQQLNTDTLTNSSSLGTTHFLINPFNSRYIEDISNDSWIIDSITVNSSGLTYFNGYLFLIVSTMASNTTVAQINMTDASIINTFSLPVTSNGISFFNDKIYAIEGNIVTVFSYPALNWIETFALGTSSFDASCVLRVDTLYSNNSYTYYWAVGKSGSPTKYRIWNYYRPTDKMTKYELFKNPYCMALDQYGRLFVTEDDSLLEVINCSPYFSGFLFSPLTNLSLRSYSTPTLNIGGIAFDGRFFWLTARQSQQLIKIDLWAIMQFDYDKDQVFDAYEADHGMNLRSNDTDGDSLPDGLEVQLHLDPTNASDASGDLDGDGLINSYEYAIHTNLTSADTDNDGLSDGQEILYHCDPLNPDSDGDGLLDGYDPRPLVPPHWWERLGYFGWSIICVCGIIITLSVRFLYNKNL